MIDQERPELLATPEDIAELKGALRNYLVHMPPALKDKYTAAIETTDVEALSDLVTLIDSAFSYINEKDDEEGARHAALRDRLQAWIDSILAK